MKKHILYLILLFSFSSFSQKITFEPIVAPIQSFRIKIENKNGILFYQHDKSLNPLNGDYKISIFIKDVNAKDIYIVENGVGKMTLKYDLPYSGYIRTNIVNNGVFIKGYKNGLWKTTYKNKLVKIENWRKGLAIGRYRVYNTKGELLYKTSFGKYGHGQYKDYYYDTGQLKQEGAYENGKKQGEWCDYDKNIITKLLLLLFILNSNSICSQQRNLQLPPISLNSLFLNTEIRNGIEFYSYNYENKKIENNKLYRIYYKTIQKLNHHPNDIIRPTSDFAHGQFTEITSTGYFINNLKNGLWKTTYKNKLVKTENWRKGLAIGRYRVYNTKGELLYKTSFGKYGHGKYKDYYYNTGQLKQEGSYENGKKQGEWCNYDKEGNLIKTTYYDQGIPKTD